MTQDELKKANEIADKIKNYESIKDYLTNAIDNKGLKLNLCIGASFVVIHQDEAKDFLDVIEPKLAAAKKEFEEL